MNCSFCCKICKNPNSLRNHERLCKFNPSYTPPKPKTEAWKNAIKNRNHSNGAKKAKELGVPYIVSEETRRKTSEFMKRRNATDWTPEKRVRHSTIMRNAVMNNPDSYSKNNVVGRVKNIEYKGQLLKGAWEVIVAKALDGEQIKWTNDITPFNYFFEGKWHLYFPDFYLPDYDVYIEVKGYERERDRAKWTVVRNLLIIKAAQIKLLKQGHKISNLISK
jgi:hypothetical protein